MLIAWVAIAIMLNFLAKDRMNFRKELRKWEADRLWDDMFWKLHELAHDPINNQKELEEFVPICREVDRIYRQAFPHNPPKKSHRLSTRFSRAR